MEIPEEVIKKAEEKGINVTDLILMELSKKGESASILSEKLGDWVLEGWSNAYFLHVWGFHEGKLKVEYVSRYINPIKRMLEEAEKII
jgi:hypothetical protein